MSATVTAPERIDVEGPTRASIDVTESTSAEIRAFADRNDCDIHLERRGGRTYLVAVTDR